MDDSLTIVFFLWRKEGSRRDEFRSFYNDDHQELVAKTVSPPPTFFERNFRVDEAGDAIPHHFGLSTFDSFTAATFARRADYEAWGRILADPATAKMLDDNEAEFTRPDCRVQLVADVVRAGAIRPVGGAGVSCWLRLVPAADGIEPAGFRESYEAADAEHGPLPGEVRRIRYYPQPTSPLSYVRKA